MRLERRNVKAELTFFSRLALAAAALLGAGLLATSTLAQEAGNVADKVSGTFGSKTSDILDDPEQWVGKTVTIRDGEIKEVISDRAFVLASGLLAKGSGLLVVSSSRFPAAAKLPGGAFQKDNDVAVTGVVRIFSGAEIEKEIGWALEDRWKTAHEKKPVIVATEVMLLDKD